MKKRIKGKELLTFKAITFQIKDKNLNYWQKSFKLPTNTTNKYFKLCFICCYYSIICEPKLNLIYVYIQFLEVIT